MEKTGRLWAALWVATFGLVAAASFAPGARLWGINHLAFYPLWVRLAILGLAAASAVPAVADLVARSARRLAAWAGPRHRAVAVAVSLGCFALFVIFPSATLLLGDGYFVAYTAHDRAAADASTFLASLRHLHPVFPATDLLYTLSSRAARPLGVGAATVIRVLAALIGQQIVFGLALWLFRPRPRAHAAERLPGLLLAGSGAVVLFFGYVEVYTPFLGAVVLYAIAAHRALRRAGPVWKPAVWLAVAIALHRMGVLLLPSLAWLVLFAARGHVISPLLRAISTWACVAMVPLPWLLRLLPNLEGLVRPLAGEPGAMLEPAHLADAANLLLLVCPAIAVVGGVALWRRVAARPERGATPTPVDPEGAFAALIAAPFFVFLLAFHSHLGGARDWDLFAPAGLACLVLVGLELRRLPAGMIPPRLTVPTVVLCAAMTLAWIGVNASDERSVARYRAVLEYDATRVADLAYAYEQLATYYMERKDIRAEVDTLERAVQLSRNPRYRFTLGMRYYHLGQKERAIGLLRQVLLSVPHDARARQMLAMMLHFEARYDEVASICDEGIRLDPLNPTYHFLKGRALARSGSAKQALDSLRRARSLDPPEELVPQIDELIRSLESDSLK